MSPVTQDHLKLGKMSNTESQSDWSSKVLSAIALINVPLTIMQLFSPLNPIFPTANFLLFFVPFWLVIWREQLAPVVLIWAIPLVSAPDVQFEALFGRTFGFLVDSGVDPVAGVLAGLRVRRLLRGPVQAGHPTSADRFARKLLAAYAVYLLVSAIIAVVGNLVQSGSSANLGGMMKHLLTLRFHGWLDDFLPLRSVWIGWAGISIAALFVDWFKDNDSVRRNFVDSAVRIGMTIAAFGIWQWLTGKGFFRNGPERGVQSLFPDLHSFVGYITPFVLMFFYDLFWGGVSKSKLGALVKLLIFCGAMIASDSRSTNILIAGFVAVSCLVSFSKYIGQKYALRRTQRALIVALPIALAFGFLWKKAQDLLVTYNLDQLSARIGDRPEIFHAAWRMGREFPILGLGLNTFPRNGVIRDFSKSIRLSDGQPENAHNYFLQVFVEQGGVGLALLLTILLLAFRRNRLEQRGYLNFALFGFILTNLYAHALLVTEIALVFWCFIGASFAGSTVQSQISETSKRRKIGLVIGVIVLVVLGTIERVQFRQKPPYIGNPICHLQSNLYSDNWTGGKTSVETKAEKDGMFRLLIDAARPDITSKNPLSITAKLRIEGRDIVETHLFESAGQHQFEFKTDLPKGTVVPIELFTSSCFVPKNFGENFDTRKLGVLLRRQ